MARFNLCKTLCITFLAFAAAAIPSRGQSFNILAAFNGVDGANPNGSLVQGPDGNYYGTTAIDGPVASLTYGEFCDFCGAVFKISPTGTLTTLYSFCARFRCPDGGQPNSGLVLGTDGNFYGTAEGVTEDAGTVFKMTPAGKLATLYSFCAQPNCIDGMWPQGTLVQAAGGDFYGMTIDGGGNACPPFQGCGTIFKITAEGEFSSLYQFTDDSGTGNQPAGGLIQASDGNLYGTTLGGGYGNSCPGIGGCGTVFRISPQGDLTYVHRFSGPEGGGPQAPVLQATDGNLYGTTVMGGRSDSCGEEGCGTVFRITSDGQFTMLYTFCSQPACPDGSFPSGGLFQGSDGNLYGMTIEGGANGDGTIFEITPAGELTTLYSFCSQPSCSDGIGPFGALVQGTDGTFYGTTEGGGNSTCNESGTPGCGTVFSLSTGLGPFVAFVRPFGKVGQTGGILGQGFTGTTSVMLNGVPANYTVVSDTYIKATVPFGATTGFVKVTTPSGVLTSNVPFRVIQ